MPDYFLEKQWADFAFCLSKVLTELKAALKRAFGPSKTSLTDTEKVFVAIPYNKESVNLSKAFKGDDGRYYGENIFDFLRVSQSVSVEARAKSTELLPGRNDKLGQLSLEQCNRRLLALKKTATISKQSLRNSL